MDTTEWLHFQVSVSCIGERNGNLLQCFCLENPRDGGAWWAVISGVAQSQTWLKRLNSGSRVTNTNTFIMYTFFPLLCCHLYIKYNIVLVFLSIINYHLKMVRWDGWTTSLIQWHEFEQTLGDDEGLGSLECCSLWGHEESDTTW